MEVAALVAALQDALPGVPFEAASTIDLQPTVYAPADRIPDIARALRDRPDLRFAVLLELTAVDYHPHTPRFEVVYTLLSVEHRARLRLKVRLADDPASLRTVSDIWPAANWLERE